MVTDGIQIAYVTAGSGPPVLLLHGYPQCKEMWAKVAARLADRYTVVAADLRGYGASSKPAATPDADTYSFRAMAADMAALMAALGHERFHFVGHDRGARVGHRFARDHGARLLSLTLMDIIPTTDVWVNMDTDFVLAYWHWPFLAQAHLAATMIARDPDGFFETCLQTWGKAKLNDFDPTQLDAYRQAWRDPAMIAASCADYRAAALVDPAHDDQDRTVKIPCPVLVMEGRDGVVGNRFDVAGLWQNEAVHPVRHNPIPGGHFFIDMQPDATASAVLAFLDDVSS